MNFIEKLVHTAVDQVLEFAEIPPPLLHAWSGGQVTPVIMAAASFVPHIVLLCSMIGLLFRPSMIGFFTFAGLFANKLLNLVLKYSIQQPRPVNPWKRGYGMPSDHAQFMGYLSFFPFLLYGFLLRTHPELSLPPSLSLFLPLLIALFVCYSRISVGVHSTEQVVWGFLIGLAFSFVWYHIGVYLYTRHYLKYPTQTLRKTQ